MSETSSDAESSCGWTIISNEGSDIETLASEAVVEAELAELSPLEDKQASASNAQCAEEKVAESPDETLEEETIDETLCASEAAHNTKGTQHVAPLSSSDHSDIVTLGDAKEDEHTEVEEVAAVNEEFYLGTSCSSQYAFTASEAVCPVQQPIVTNSSSSEDEAERSTTAVVRRRRLRKNTTSVVAEPEEDLQESGQSEEEEEEDEEQQQQEDEAEVKGQDVRMQGQGSSILNGCILIALVIAVSMGFGHFYGTVQILERHKTEDKIRGNELDVLRDLIQQHIGEQPFTSQVKRVDFGLDDLDEQDVISLLTEVIEKMKEENQELKIKQVHIQAQRDDLEILLKQKTEEKTHLVSQQQRLTAENQLLKTSLERGEQSLSSLQEELRVLRSTVQDREAMGASADSLLSEIQRLKDQLEEEKRLVQSVHAERDDMMAETQTLEKQLDEDRIVTDELRRELNVLRSHFPGAGKEAGSEADELQSRLMRLQERLVFEQQRSDLWERLYVETKENRAKGDTESKVKRRKEGMAGKVKETFDAVKNSTKEFVHHHKEQIKKAKEAVKENLRKFSDSVKSTFQHFKDSASTFINKARGFHVKGRAEKNTKETWKHRSHKPHHGHQGKFDDSFESDRNTRKSGDKVHEGRGHDAHKRSSKGCSGIFSCAYQESTSLFNKAMEPIRADKFHQLLESYVRQEVDHFQHWKELELLVNDFFQDGVFIRHQIPFTDFLSIVENYLSNMHESGYIGLHGEVLSDLHDFIYRHVSGESNRKHHGPNGPFDGADADSKESSAKHQHGKQQRARPRPHSERKWRQSGRNTDRHMADVKIELGPMPFDPKY